MRVDIGFIFATLIARADWAIAQSVEPVPTAIIEYIDALAQRSSRLHSEFDIVRRESVPIDDAVAWDIEAWSQRPETGRVTARWWYGDGRVRVEYLLPGTKQEPPRIEQVNIWDGSGWFQRVNRDPYPTGNEDVVGLYYVYAHPRAGGVEEAFSLFHGCATWPSFVSFISLPSVLRDLPVIESRMTGSELELIFARGDQMRVHLVFETQPELTLKAIENRTYTLSAEGELEHLTLRKRIHFLEWRDYEVGELPARALSLGVLYRHPSIEPGASVPLRIDELVRQSAAMLDSGESTDNLFQPPDAPRGYQVGDFRSGISYVVGRSRIAVDGYMFELAQPIEALITTNLGEILGNAKPPKELSGGHDEEPES